MTTALSSSMMGMPAKWAGAVTLALLELAQEQHMRVGYVEFNHQARRHEKHGQFFVKDIDSVARLAARTRVRGTTNYQAPLSMALDAFATTNHWALARGGVRAWRPDRASKWAAPQLRSTGSNLILDA